MLNVDELNGQHDAAHVQSLEVTENESHWRITLQDERAGTLTLKHENGEFDGWDWKGDELDEDEEQAVLDIFESAF